MEPVTAIVNEPDFNYAGEYTYADYLRWTIEERLELIKGRIFRMGAPNTAHQGLLGKLYVEVYNFIARRGCRVFFAPYDVRFPRKGKGDAQITTVLQPDLIVVCDPSKIDSKGCIGAPDIVVEILSPGNTRKELENKYEVYEEFGVKEYWIVDPQHKSFLKYTLGEDGKYIPGRLMGEGSTIESAVLSGFRLDLAELFSVIPDAPPY